MRTGVLRCSSFVGAQAAARVGGYGVDFCDAGAVPVIPSLGRWCRAVHAASVMGARSVSLVGALAQVGDQASGANPFGFDLGIDPCMRIESTLAGACIANLDQHWCVDAKACVKSDNLDLLVAAEISWRQSRAFDG